MPVVPVVDARVARFAARTSACHAVEAQRIAWLVALGLLVAVAGCGGSAVGDSARRPAASASATSMADPCAPGSRLRTGLERRAAKATRDHARLAREHGGFVGRSNFG